MTGRQLAQEEVLGREPPERRKAADRALEGAVGIPQPRPDQRRLRPSVREVDEALDRAVGASQASELSSRK